MCEFLFLGLMLFLVCNCQLDVLIPGSEEDEKRRLFELGVNSFLESEESYLKILEELLRVMFSFIINIK